MVLFVLEFHCFRVSFRDNLLFFRILSLHPEFHSPLPASRLAISPDPPPLSGGLSPMMRESACARFTPSNSGQRLDPTSYRGCWHVVSRSLFRGYRHCLRPLEKGFTRRNASSPTRRCSIRLAPIVENSLLLPPVGVGAVSQSPCG